MFFFSVGVIKKKLNCKKELKEILKYNKYIKQLKL